PGRDADRRVLVGGRRARGVRPARAVLPVQPPARPASPAWLRAAGVGRGRGGRISRAGLAWPPPGSPRASGVSRRAMNVIERAVRRADQVQQRHTPLAFLYGVVKKYGDDNGGVLVANLC